MCTLISFGIILIPVRQSVTLWPLGAAQSRIEDKKPPDFRDYYHSTDHDHDCDMGH